MAKAKRRASKKQLAALAKARTALKAKYGTADISKIAKKSKKRGGKKAAAAPAMSMADMLSGGAKKKPKKRRAKRTKKAATRRAAAPKKRRSTKKRRPKKTAARRAAPKRRRRRSSKRARHTVGGKVHIVKMPTAARVKVIRIEEAKRRRRRKKRALLENPMGYELAQLEENPLSYSALFENPTGPYSMSSLKSFGWAAGGVGVGLVLAELADRFIATRAPADAKDGVAKGAHPWYGRDAVAAIQRRPDAMRLGVQAAGALAGIGGAYLAGKRGGRILPWALGGAAVGFGANLAKQLLVWWVLPAILKVPVDANGQPDYSKPGWANRLVPLEQKALQDTIDGLWEKWNLVSDLNDGQGTTPIIKSPLGDQTDKNLLTLGGATGNGPLPVAGRPYWVGQPGAVGSCMSCGGMQGHWSNCPSNCQDCPDGSGIPRDGGGRDGGGYPQLCEYTVQRGDSLEELLAATGLSMNEVANLNGGGLPTTWWTPGNTVSLPVAMCMEITRRRQPSEPRIPPPTRTSIPREPPVYRPTDVPTQINPAAPGMFVAGADEVSHRAALRGVGGEDNDSND